MIEVAGLQKIIGQLEKVIEDLELSIKDEEKKLLSTNEAHIDAIKAKDYEIRKLEFKL